MSATLNRVEFERVYHESLEPIFAGYAQRPRLDKRNLFYVELLARHGLLQPGKLLVDLGAGLSVFGPIARKFGMDVALVDDFGGDGGVLIGQRFEEIKVLNAFRDPLGIKIFKQNLLDSPLPFPDASVDVITCFHSLEHWHNSPRPLFREITRVVRPGGVFMIATPNAVNIRKRAFVLFGHTNLSQLREWYEDGDPVFRGHVREPVIGDLCQLMQWNGFDVVKVYGRNFIGRGSEVLARLPRSLVDTTAVLSEKILKFFPSFCSDIHVIGRRRSSRNQPVALGARMPEPS